jgi:hypothetical protein
VQTELAIPAADFEEFRIVDRQHELVLTLKEVKVILRPITHNAHCNRRF